MLLLIVALACVIAVVAGFFAIGRGNHSSTSPPSNDRTPVAAAAARSKPRFRNLVERRTGTLQSAVQDAAGVALGGNRAMLLGGLTAADISRADIRIATSASDRAAGALPTAVHDTAAVRIGDAVYVFGGGTNSGAQSDAVVRVPLNGGVPAVVGRLPAPSSDQAAAAIGGTAYIVGGYTGTRWLDTIVAWRPGSGAHVVARLPFALRYAAVAAAAGRLVIAGGSLEDGTAGSAVLEYTPGQRHAQTIGRLPDATTHAGAAAIGDVAYVIGGRGAAVGSTTARIVAVNVRTHRIRTAGTLAAARSDLAAVSFGSTILLAGGNGATGTLASLSELIAITVSAHTRPTRTSEPTTPAGNVYAYDGANMLTGAARLARPLVYVPNSEGATVDVIDPRTYKVVGTSRWGFSPSTSFPATT